jgi:hypothetical protein
MRYLHYAKLVIITASPEPSQCIAYARGSATLQYHGAIPVTDHTVLKKSRSRRWAANSAARHCSLKETSFNGYEKQDNSLRAGVPWGSDDCGTEGTFLVVK